MFTITLTFPQRDYKKCIEIINSALDNMKLSEVKISNAKTYFFFEEHFSENGEVTSTDCEFGFDMIELKCKNDDENSLHVYQMGVASFPKSEDKSYDEFHDLWSQEHPDRAMRNLVRFFSEDCVSFAFLHHEKAK